MTEKFSRYEDGDELHDRAHKLFNDLFRLTEQVALPEAHKEAPLDSLTTMYAMLLLVHVYTIRCRMAAERERIPLTMSVQVMNNLMHAAHGCSNEMNTALMQGIDPTQNEEGHLSFDALDEIRTMLAPTAGDRQKAEELAADALRKATSGLKRES